MMHGQKNIKFGQWCSMKFKSLSSLKIYALLKKYRAI